MKDLLICFSGKLHTGSATDRYTFREVKDGLVRVNYLLFYLLSFITRLKILAATTFPQWASGTFVQREYSIHCYFEGWQSGKAFSF